MNAQLLEYARIELRLALADLSGGTKGQLQAFAEHPPADKNRNPRKPVHLVELDDGRGGLRHVKAENSALYVSETRCRRSPMPPINEYEYAAASWRRAVNSLHEHEQAWVRYCYGRDLAFKYQILICEAVWKEYKKNLPADILKKTKKKIVSLIWIAIQEVASVRHNDSYKEYAGAALARMMDINRSTWSRVYASHWFKLKTFAYKLDEKVLRRILDANSK